MNVQLPSLGVNQQFITFTHVTMESEKYICVRETAPQNSVVIIDMSMPMQPLRRPITADSALMNPNNRILALKGRLTSFWCVRAINMTLLLIFDVPERNVYLEKIQAQSCELWRIPNLYNYFQLLFLLKACKHCSLQN